MGTDKEKSLSVPIRAAAVRHPCSSVLRLDTGNTGRREASDSDSLGQAGDALLEILDQGVPLGLDLGFQVVPGAVRLVRQRL
jgi:hypothetical protein